MSRRRHLVAQVTGTQKIRRELLASNAQVPSVLVNKEQSIQEARRVWENRVADIPALKKRIRARAEAAIEREIELRRAEVARAINTARDLGATKTALREVTTKGHNDFESYVALGERLAREEGE